MGARKASASRSAARKGCRRRLASSKRPARLVAALIDVAADYYWEQDAEHRFTVWRGTGAERSRAAERSRTARQDERRALSPRHGGDRRPLGAAPRRCSRHASHSATSAHAVGAADPPSTSTQRHAAYAANGDFVGYRGIARESGALARLERLLGLEGALLRGLAEADDLASALPLVVGADLRLRPFRLRLLLRASTSRAASCGASTPTALPAPSGARCCGGRAAAPDWLDSDPVWLADAGEPDGAWSPGSSSGRRGGAMIARSSSCPIAPPPGRRSVSSSSRTAKGRRPTPGSCTCCAASTVQLGHLHARAAAAERLARERAAGSRPRWRWPRSASRTSTTKAASST